jgi:hypothetical protein
VGTTASTNLFVRNALQPVFAGGTEDAFVARLILPPALCIAPGAGMVRLSWPASASGFLLEWSADETGDTWTAVPQPPVVTGGLQTVTLALTNSPVFFRLRLP